MLLMNLNLLLRSVAQLNRLIMNLRNRTGEQRRQQTLCGKRDNNFFENFASNVIFLLTDLFVKDQNMQVIALSRLSHTSVLPSSSSCLPVA